MSKIKPGNIAAINIDNDGRLYRIDSIQNGIVYLRSIDGPLVFRICFENHVWPILDSMP